MKSIRKPTFTEAVTPIVSMFFILLVGRGIYGAPIETLLIISSSIAAFIAWRVGLTWDDMIEGVSEKIAKAMPAILILIAVGIVVGTWMLSGTIPMLIYYGIQIVNPKFFFVTAFIICAILSTCTGTSWGSCATIGVVLIVIAQGLGIPLPITAAAVVGGSYFGDKMSPLSDTTNLAPLAAGANIFDHIRHMFYTTLPASLATLAIYAVLGFRTNAEVLTGTETIEGMLDNISSIFNLNVVVLFIPVIILQVYVFSTGIGLFLSQATVFFRDVQYIYAAFMTGWMYLTPIFYPINQLPEGIRWGIMTFNPLYSYITQFRTVVLMQQLPEWGMILQGSLVALGVLIVGTLCFMKNQDRFILYI